MRVDGDTTGDGGKQGMQSFSLQTSAEEAQAVVEASEEAETPVEEHVVTAEEQGAKEEVAAGSSRRPDAPHRRRPKRRGLGAREPGRRARRR